MTYLSHRQTNPITGAAIFDELCTTLSYCLIWKAMVNNENTNVEHCAQKYNVHKMCRSKALGLLSRSRKMVNPDRKVTIETARYKVAAAR